MDREVAARIAAISMECSQKVDGSVQEVMASCDERVLRAYRSVAGRVMGNILTEVLVPIWGMHEDLAPDWYRQRDRVAAARPTMDRQLQERLLHLMADIRTKMRSTVELADSASHGQAPPQLEEAVQEILAHVDAMVRFLQSLDDPTTTPADDGGPER